MIIRPALAVLALMPLSILAAPAEPLPATPAQWLARMGDFTANSLPARHPANFVGFLDAATTPEFHRQRMANLSEPAYWGKTADTLLSPGFMANLGEAAQPATAVAWLQAMADPRFYEALATVLANPAKWAQWGMAGLDPASYAVFMKPLDPNVQARWVQETASPANWFASFNPVLRRDTVGH